MAFQNAGALRAFSRALVSTAIMPSCCGARPGTNGACPAHVPRLATGSSVMTQLAVTPRIGGVTASCVVTLEPVASRGTWAGRAPFDGMLVHPPKTEGMIAVLTRARLKARKAPAFWKAIDPVSRALPGADGMICAFGIGEAPVGFQGTVSLWRSAADVVRFAYRQPEHAAVVDRTGREGWYAEELFARFRVLDVTGDREVIGWRDRP